MLTFHNTYSVFDVVMLTGSVDMFFSVWSNETCYTQIPWIPGHATVAVLFDVNQSCDIE